MNCIHRACRDPGEDWKLKTGELACDSAQDASLVSATRTAAAEHEGESAFARTLPCGGRSQSRQADVLLSHHRSIPLRIPAPATPPEYLSSWRWGASHSLRQVA